MRFKVEKGSQITVLHVAGELDALSVAELRATLEEVATAGTDVTIDLEGLRLIDSSGVGAIVSVYRRVRSLGGQVFVRNADDQPLAIFRLLKLDHLLFERPAAHT